jgi:hypothetical protein
MSSPFGLKVEVEERATATQQSTLILSSPMKVDLAVYRGDSGQFRITITDPFGVPIDLSTATWDGDIRIKAVDVDPVTTFDIAVAVDDPSAVDVSLPADKSELLSGVLVYDIEMREGESVTTLIYGTISVTQDVSRPE